MTRMRWRGLLETPTAEEQSEFGLADWAIWGSSGAMWLLRGLQLHCVLLANTGAAPFRPRPQGRHQRLWTLARTLPLCPPHTIQPSRLLVSPLRLDQRLPHTPSPLPLPLCRPLDQGRPLHHAPVPLAHSPSPS